MPLPIPAFKWISVAAAWLLLLSAQGVQAQPAGVPLAWPPPPNALAGTVALPDNCRSTLVSAGNSTVHAIHDNSTVNTSIVVTQSVPYIWTVTVGASISHTYPADLEINLISPLGTIVTLANRRAGSHDDAFAFVYWFDTAPELTTDADYSLPQNSLVPEEAMGAFQGQNGTGVWHLVVTDHAVSDTGTLNGWFLQIISLPAGPITSHHHFSLVSNSLIPDLSSNTTQLLVGNLADKLVNAKLTTSISHAKPGQLNISLKSPQAVTTTISSGTGGSLVDWFKGTQWLDKAGSTFPPGPVTMDQAVYTTSPLTASVPEGAMGAFAGFDPNGNWQLKITDTVAGTTGTLNSWGLDLTIGHCAPLYLPLVDR